MATIIEQINYDSLDPRQYSSKDTKVIGEYPVTSKFDPNTDTIEFYIYDINKNLISYTPEFTQYKVIDPSINQEGLSTINIDIEESVSRRGFEFGTYNVVFNFFRNQLNSSFRRSFFIKEISSNRTELRLASNLFPDEKLEEKVTQFIESNSQEDYFSDFVVNFGENNQYIANNILLDKTDPNNFSVLIKLYSPLPLQFEKNDTLWIATEVSDPRAFKITFEEEPITTKNAIPLRGPNYNINVKDQISNPTNLVSNNDLLTDTQLTSSYNQLQNILSKKGINVNINYTTFSNFCHFSSAEQRLENFYYKVGLIESASSQISQSLNITSSYTASSDFSSSIANLEFTISDTIANFDGYENYLYYTTGSDNLTWPKSTSTPIPNLYGTGSAQVLSWYGSVANQTGLIYSASLYDEENQDNLVYTIPEYLREDSSNAPYQLFIEMMGQYFDELYLYADDITNKHNADNRLDSGISKDIVGDVLKSFGIKLYENNFSSDDLYASLIGINGSGSLNAPTGSDVIETYISASTDVIPLDDVNKETYKRIYHNMPYLLKKKGTVEGLKTLLNIFGIPDTILRVSEFGGRDVNSASTTYDYYQNVFNYGYTSNGGKFTTNFSSSTAFGGTQPEGVFFRFKYISGALPANGTSFVIASSSGAETTLVYKGGAGVSASFSGSILSASEFSGEIKLGTARVSGSLFNGEWWNVGLSDKSAVKVFVGAQDNVETDGFKAGYITSSVGNATLTGNVFELNPNTRKFEFQECKFFNTEFTDQGFKDLVMDPYKLINDPTKDSKNTLFFRSPLGAELEINRTASATNFSSYHPAITGSAVTQSFQGGASNYRFNTANATYSPQTQSIYYNQPYAGVKNRISDKIKEISYTIPNNTLSPFRSVIQDSEYGGGYNNPYGRDFNLTEVAFSPMNEINDDIISTLPSFDIGQYIGDPNFLTEPSASYPGLNTVRDNYFLKYYSAYEWRDYVRLIKYFNNSLFKMIQDFTPAKSSVTTGVVIKQHLLERNKYPTPQVTQSAVSHDNGSSIRPNDQLTGLISLPSISGSENIANGGTGGVFDPDNILKEEGGFQLESNLDPIGSSFVDLLGDSNSSDVDAAEDVIFLAGSPNQLIVTRAFNTGVLFRLDVDSATGNSGTLTVKVVSSVRGVLASESKAYSAGSLTTILTPNIDLFPGELISFEGKTNSATEVLDEIGIFFGDDLASIAQNSIPTSQQVYRKTFNTPTGSFTVFENCQREFYNGELPIIKTALSGNVVTNTETVDAIQATNQAVTHSMGGVLPFVSQSVKFNVAGSGNNLPSAKGLFSYEGFGVGINYVDPTTTYFDIYVKQQQQNNPASFKDSVHFVRNPAANVGVTRMIIGFGTGSDQAFTASMEGLQQGDQFNIVFASSPSASLQPVNVPYTFTVGAIQKVDPGFNGTAYFDIIFGGGVNPSQGNSFIFNQPQLTSTGAPIGLLNPDGTNGVGYGGDCDIQFLIPVYGINDDGVQQSITTQNANHLFNEANPVANSVNINRYSYTFQNVEFSTGIVTASNIALIANSTAERAQVQDSNYTKTGHINARYNGSRASSPDFNIRSKVN